MNKMKIRHTILAAMMSLASYTISGQTVADSIAIVSAHWEVTAVSKGIVHKCASFSSLYKGGQHVNVVEVAPDAKVRYGIAASGQMKQTSLIAQENGALAAINGSYYNMKKGNSVCYFRVGKEVIDTTLTSEFDLRVTGALHTHKGNVKFIPWSPRVEERYRQRKGTILASGPLLLDDGELCDWKSCGTSFINNKHPRSAIFRTKDGRIVFITVDGRSPGNAAGVSIPELAHLVRVLGGYDALNLDGGGSTTLWTEAQGITNCPSDNKKFDHQGERKVANIIYVAPRK
jgi:exopolysaccharide biosynthesis protein